MPTLADLDNPPPSRWPLLLGVLVAVGVVGVVGMLLLPAVRGTVMQGSADFDDRARARDEYMFAVCTQALLFERDESLCKCVLAAEFPSLDCEQPFLEWSALRQDEQCGATDDPAAKPFCECAQRVAKAVRGAADLAARRQAGAGYADCIGIEGGPTLPTIEALMPTPAQEAAQRKAQAERDAAMAQ